MSITPVKLYVYDLSNGIARQLSSQLTGRQIDGIWHTSVVVFGKEIFYGQGVSVTRPGRSHHGTPLQVMDMGETAIDEETFNEYLEEIRLHYTADKYHLLEFNCNSFTNDCVGFLTGGSIPSWIKDLPQDFLSTPFGQALRPTIDSMYRGRPAAPIAPVPQPTAPLTPQTSSLLSSIATQAQRQPQLTAQPQPSGSTYASTSTLTSPIHLSTNLPSFISLLSTHKCLVAFFSSDSCAPCKLIEPEFERLAMECASPKRVGFVKVELGGINFGTQAVASKWSVRATPTVIMFLDGAKVAEVKGANPAELKSQVDLLLFEAFPPHPHIKKEYRTVRAISLEPILFKQIPSWDAACSKLNSFIDKASGKSISPVHAKGALEERVLPFLKARFPPPNKEAAKLNGINGSAHKGAQIQMAPKPQPELLKEWHNATLDLIDDVLPAHDIFPLIDFWRVGVLDANVATWLAASGADTPGAQNVIEVILNRAASIMQGVGVGAGAPNANPRNVLLTTLRLLCNAFGNAALARHMLDPRKATSSEGKTSRSGTWTPHSPRQRLTALLVTTVLHEDGLIRTAAASLAFNIAVHQQKPLVEAVRDGRARRGESEADSAGGEDGQGDWEVEIVTAIVEAIQRAEDEDVVHRLTASLALLIHLSPYLSQLAEVLEVLGVKEMVKNKKVTKSEVRKLMNEVVEMITSC